MSVHDLQAPTEDGALLAYPPLERAGELLEQNRRRLAHFRGDILGQSFQSLRTLARREIIGSARQYLAAADEPVPDDQSDVLFLAGHQPELFHPGVWIKNFALNGLARAHGGVALNLIVDSDTAKNTLLHLPAGDRIARVPFDLWQSEVPFEERRVRDEALFRDLPQAASRIIRDWSFTPMLGDFWAEVCRQANRTPLLGERFAAARRHFERQWDCTNYEVPLSLVCQSGAFAWFGCHLLDNLPRFQEIYNAAVEDYRQRHGVRSRNHPVPDLAQEGDWLEAPFWAWRTGQIRRSRLFARRSSDGFALRAGSEEWPALRCGSKAEDFIAQWRTLLASGYKIRSRALTTTLFARLFVGDIFLHGLGGGKYDKLTDAIVRRFYGIEPPSFLVLTGTLLLPFTGPAVSADDCRRLEHHERDLWWNPQRHLQNGAAKAHRLGEDKAHWIYKSTDSAQERRERFERLRQLTAELRPFVADEEMRTRTALEQTSHQLQVRRVEGRRDYAFCLYPGEMLHRFCRQVS